MILRRDNIARRLRKAVYSVQGRTGDVTLTAGDVDAQVAKKDNLTATTNPTENDDGTQGYEVLSKWMNTTTGKMFTCLNIAHGSAIWKAEDINIADLGSASVKNVGTADTEVPLVSTVKSLIPAQQSKASLGLDQVDNTPDNAKPVSQAQAMAIQDVVTQLTQNFVNQINNSLANVDYSSIKNAPVLFSGSYNDLSDKPSLFNGDYRNLTNTPVLFDGKYSSLSGLPILFDGEWSSLRHVPSFFDGKYSSLTGAPNLFDGDYNSLTSRPVLFSGSFTDLKNLPSFFDGKYSSLTGTPNLFSGNYSDLAGLPLLFDGDYNKLSNKPALFSGSYTSLTDKPTLFDGKYSSLTGKPTLFNGDYNSLANLPVLFSKSYNDLTDKPVLFSGNYADLSGKPILFNGDYNQLNNRPALFSGSYIDLTNKPTIPTSTTQITEGANLYYTAARIQAYLDSKNIKGVKYFEVTTDTNSLWTLDVSTYFSAVDFVTPIALSPMAGTVPLITEQRMATLISFSNLASIKGSVAKSATVAALLQAGIGLGGAGITVKVKVEGTLK